METHKRILVIDDESVIVSTLSAILKREGYEIATALNGEEAIRCAREFQPDFLLSDIAMPGLDGVDAVLRILEFVPRAQVLFISGHANSMDALDKARAKGYEFELAIKPMDPRALLQKIAQALKGKAERAPVVLCVDDDPGTRYGIARFLNLAGFKVLEADSGRTALLRAQEHPDLILLVIGLPDFSGFDVCEMLRKSPETAQIPVVYLTNTYRDDKARARAVELGARAFLTHPVDPDALCALLKTLTKQ